MKLLFSRMLVAIWFLGMIWVVGRSVSAQGENGELAKMHMPLLFRNIPVVDEPALAGYLGLFSSSMGQASDQRELYTVRADGTELRQLTDNEFVESSPLWSPDGAQIAFLQDNNRLMVMNRDGSHQRLLYEVETAHLTAILWMPSSQAILVHEIMVDPPYQGRIVQVNVVSGVQDVVADATLGWVGLSRNGQSLLVRRAATTEFDDLWLVPLAGGDEVLLCTGCEFLDWHPSYQQVLYRERPTPTETQGFLVNIDGSSRHLLYQSPFQFSHWLENGSDVLLTNADDGDVYSVGVLGGVPEILIQSNRTIAVFDVSPRDSSVLYVEPFLDGISEQLFIQPLDGSSPTSIPRYCLARYCFSRGAQWSDDGSHILYVIEEQHPRTIGINLQGIAVTDSTPTPTDLMSGPLGQDALHLPFSSRYIYATLHDAYGASHILPYVIDASIPSAQPLPFSSNAITTLVEWRYLP